MQTTPQPFVQELAQDSFSTAGGDSTHVRVQVTTNAGALDRDQQLGVVKDFTALVGNAAGDPTLEERTWVSLTEAVPGGWGIAGHAHTNEEIVQHARTLPSPPRPASPPTAGGCRSTSSASAA